MSEHTASSVLESFVGRPTAGHFGFVANVRTADGWFMLHPQDYGFPVERNGFFRSEADALAAIAKASA